MDGLADIQHQDGASWQVRLARLRRSPRLYLFIEGGTLLVLASTCLMTYLVVSGQKQPDKLLPPPVVALLLVANLVPAVALLVLLGRRLEKRRAAHTVIGGEGPVNVRLARLRRSPRLYLFIEGGTLLVLASTCLMTYLVVSGQKQPDKLLTPPVVALLLVANLVPAIALLVLLGRRIAKRRAAQSVIGGDGQLHVRLVAIFSIIASVPMLFVVIFASLLFQYGVQFWFSDNARSMLQNANGLARGYYEQNKKEVGDETVTMARDLRDYLSQAPVSSPQFAEGYIFQVVTRKLNESAIIEIGKDGVARTAAMVDPDNRAAEKRLTGDVIHRLAQGENVVVKAQEDRIEAVTLLDPAAKIYLYASRDSDVPAFSQMERARAVLADYDDFTARSRALQLQFNAALFLGSLLLVGLTVWIALAVADRLVRPVAELVDTARRITAGDLSARVPGPHTRDEVGTLASAFNRMTQRLEAQTSALVNANSQLDNRRAFIEAVLSGVTAGILDRKSTRLNSSHYSA